MAVRTESLLDKLYNLRGKDSSILREMDEQKNAAEETKEKTTEQKAILQKEIEDLKLQREELEDQGEKFKNMLKGINRDDYDTVLKRLNLDFDPEGLLDKLNETEVKPAEDENSEASSPVNPPVISNISVETYGVDYGEPETIEPFDYNSYINQLYGGSIN